MTHPSPRSLYILAALIYVLGLVAFTFSAFGAEIPAYSRAAWRHWIDADRDGEDTRQEVLQLEARAGQTWRCPYSGTLVTDPRQLDIDHLVPLKNAHDAGGWQFTPEQKQAYANDLSHDAHLGAVVARWNRQKGSRGPEDWKPPDERAWCAYAYQWATVKRRWHLTMTSREQAAVIDMLLTCAEPRL